jgi:hypothetical protein
MDAIGQAYPATFDVDRQDRIANWRPLVQWLLAIPHLLILNALQTVSRVVAVVSWFAIVFTGTLPDGLARLQSLYIRYNNRTIAYAGFLRDDYPPFTYDTVAPEPGDYPPVRTGFTPELENRNRVTVGFRLILAIPQIIVVLILGIAAIVVWLIGLFAVLFTGRWPEGLRAFVVGVMRWGTRVEAYVGLLTDTYPPFSLE